MNTFLWLQSPYLWKRNLSFLDWYRLPKERYIRFFNQLLPFSKLLYFLNNLFRACSSSHKKCNLRKFIYYLPPSQGFWKPFNSLRNRQFGDQWQLGLLPFKVEFFNQAPLFFYNFVKIFCRHLLELPRFLIIYKYSFPLPDLERLFELLLNFLKYSPRFEKYFLVYSGWDPRLWPGPDTPKRKKSYLI